MFPKQNLVFHLITLITAASKGTSELFYNQGSRTELGSNGFFLGLGFEGLHSPVLCLVLQPFAVCVACSAGI